MADKNSAKVLSSKTMELDWQTESDMRTLLEAQKIKADPKRMKAVQDAAKEKLQVMALLATGQDEDD